MRYAGGGFHCQGLNVLVQAETNNPKLRWAYLPYSMHMAGPREAIQHMIIRKNYGGWCENSVLLSRL
jgi:ATP sulfurylase